MNMIDDDELQAWIDGELAPADAERVAAAVAADPELARRAERARRLGGRLRAAFDPVLDEPVPAHLRALLQADAAPAARQDAGADNVVALRGRLPRTGPSRRWHAPVYALAASLAALAMSLWLRPDAGPVQLRGDALVARGALQRALDDALAAAPQAGAAVAIGVTFRDAEGRICRSFVQQARPALAGLACREDGQWAVPVLARPHAGAGGELRQASAAMPPEVQAAIDERLQGDAFDADQERAARAARWR